MKTRLLTLGIVLGILAAVVATAQAGTPKGAAVTLRKTSLGTILVDPHGRTLYLFEKDANGMSACDAACLGYWPAYTSRAVPRAGKGVRQSLLRLAAPQHGLRQVTYAGHPLYTFVGDKQSGQTTGEGLSDFGGGWDVLAASGQKIEKSNDTGSGNGYSSGRGY